MTSGNLAESYDFVSRDVIRESMADVGTLANNVLGSNEKWSLDGLCQNLVSNRQKTSHYFKFCDMPCTTFISAKL